MSSIVSSTKDLSVVTVRVVAVVLCLLLASCTNDTLRSSPGEPSGGSDQSQAEGAEVEEAEVAVEPTDTFVRIDVGSFADRSPQISIQDAAVSPDLSHWVFTGFVEDGKSRLRSAVVSAVAVSKDAADNTLTTLPSNDKIAAGTAIRPSDDGMIIGGYIVNDEATTPVVWKTNDGGDTATVTELSSSSPNARITKFATGDGAPVALGTALADGVTSPQVWRATGDSWTAIDVAELEGRSETSTLVMSAATTLNDQLVIVGALTDLTSDPTPLLWVERDGQLEVVETSGLPDTGHLYDLAVDRDDQLLLVGATTVDAISTPLFASASSPNGPWSANSPSLETYGSSVTTGFGLHRIIVADDALWATVTEPFLQQLYRSTDGGRTWTTNQDLSGLTGHNLPSSGFAASAGQLVIAGGDIAVQSDGSSFTRLEDQAVLPTQVGDLDVSDVIVANDSWFVVGSSTERTSSGFDYSSALWKSLDGIQWGSVAIEQPDASVGAVLFADEDDQVTAVLGGSKFFTDPVYLSSDDGSGTWTTSSLDIPAQANRLLPTHAVRGPGGSALIAGSQLIEIGPTVTDTRNKPLFLIVEADGSSREALLTSSPVDPELNGEVNCMAGEPGNYMAVLSWGTRQVEVASSAGGERWSASSTTNDFAGFDVTDCLVSDDERVVVGQDGEGRPVVGTSSDNGSWTITTLDGLGAANGIAEVAGDLYLVGWTESELGSDGAIWKRTGAGEWEQLANTGLESDQFSEFVGVRDLVEQDGVVVAVGADQGRAGVWMASTEVLSK